MDYSKFLLFLILALVSCKPDKILLLIDNPTNEPIELKFNNAKSISLEAGSRDSILLNRGKVSLLVRGSDAHTFYLDTDKEYLLNPAFQNYYVETVVYFTSSKGEKNYLNNYGTPKSKILEYEVNGRYELIDSVLLIEKHWKYGIGEDPSEGLLIRTNVDKGYYTVTRLHREQDLVEQIKKQYGQELLEYLLTESDKTENE